MKQNILVLNYEFPPLGWWGWVVSYDICRWYIDAWYSVDVVTMWFKNLPQYENKEWVNIYRVKCIRTSKEVCHPWEQLTYLFSAFFRVRGLLKNRKYDLCHCHFLIPTGILALVLKKFFWLKYIVTSHWSDVPWYNPNRFKYLHKFTPWLLKRIINNAEEVISPSMYLANLIKKNIKWINKDIKLVPNWIDTKKFIPLEKEKIVLWIWRLWPLKWLHLLAEAFSEIENVKWYELHICWDGPLMNKLKEIQKKSKNKIVLHWWMDNTSNEYIKLLWRAKIFCLPSVSENSPISILEWMSSWCSVVTTNTTWCFEMAKDIWVFIEPNVNCIKKTLCKLISDDACWEYWEKARKKAIVIYDKNIIIWQYVNICEMV